MPLTVSVSSNAAAVAQQLAVVAPREFVTAIIRAMRLANQGTVKHIQKGKLTAAGPRYLNVDTGRFRRSVRATEPRAEGSRVVSEIGSNVIYARRHEFGFSGTERVRGFVRRVRSRGFTRKIDGRRPRAATGVAFVRRVNTPARRPFRDGIEEQRDAYRAGISRAIVAAWKTQL